MASSDHTYQAARQLQPCTAAADASRRRFHLAPVLACSLRRLSAVCSRFRRLAVARYLQGGQLDVAIASERPAERTGSLRAWLERHATEGQLRSITLSVRQIVDLRAPVTPEEDQQAERAQADVLPCLLAAARGRPEGASLRLGVHLTLPLWVKDSWLSAFSGLSRLELSGMHEIEAPLGQLAGLRHLSMDFGTEATESQATVGYGSLPFSLPLSLTTLEVGRFLAVELAEQIAPLSRLGRLKLRGSGYEYSDAMGFLTGLSSLRLLSLVGWAPLPDWLPKLTWLEALHWEGELEFDSAQEATEELDWKLGPLTQLTYLHFRDTGIHLQEEYRQEDDADGWETLPSALTGMTRLHTLAWLVEPCVGPEGFQLRGWMGSLRRLALLMPLARWATGELALWAPQLEWLCLTCVTDGWEGQDDIDTLRAAVAMPGLSRLAYELPDNEDVYAELLEEARMLAWDPSGEGGEVAAGGEPLPDIDNSSDGMLADMQGDHGWAAPA